MEDFGETIRTWKLIDGSASGARSIYYVDPPPEQAPTFEEEMAEEEELEEELEGALEAVTESDEFKAGDPDAEILVDELEEAIEEVEEVIEIAPMIESEINGETVTNSGDENVSSWKKRKRKRQNPAALIAVKISPRIDEQILYGTGAAAL